jgi:putative PIN family toxin of toxin-antitoxin system
MKIVLDTNVFLNAISPNARNYWIWENLDRERLVLCVTTDILAEYEEIIASYYDDAEFASDVLDALQLLPLQNVTKHYFFRLIPQDQDDEKFVDCAIAAGATYIVTNDKHFNVLKKINFPVVKVVNETEFKALFEEKFGKLA